MIFKFGSFCMDHFHFLSRIHIRWKVCWKLEVCRREQIGGDAASSWKSGFLVLASCCQWCPSIACIVLITFTFCQDYMSEKMWSGQIKGVLRWRELVGGEPASSWKSGAANYNSQLSHHRPFNLLPTSPIYIYASGRVALKILKLTNMKHNFGYRLWYATDQIYFKWYGQLKNCFCRQHLLGHLVNLLLSLPASTGAL